ncbi:MAG: hypothetical protein KC438_00010 [Thermomicrobiales bacterium]|nr:hypothetical protein [Thermomicrobiales bacterium]MCO5221800.1 hypothetical protein [Thermomicrobiales bacterium]
MERFRQLREQMPANLPSMDELRAATAGKSQADIAASARKSLEGMDQEKLTAFGQVLQENLARKGIKPPPGVSQGNANEIASLMASMISGQNAASAKSLLQNPAIQQSASGVVMARLLTSRFGLIAMLLKDPRTAQVVGPMLKSLIKTK